MQVSGCSLTDAPILNPQGPVAVAQDWNWLFLYPAEGVASVNERAFPADRPLSLTVTSDTVMNAFFIPALDGQGSDMAGMKTRMNLAADAPGRLRGRNTQFDGDGFPEQTFTAIAMTEAYSGASALFLGRAARRRRARTCWHWPSPRC